MLNLIKQFLLNQYRIREICIPRACEMSEKFYMYVQSKRRLKKKKKKKGDCGLGFIILYIHMNK